MHEKKCKVFFNIITDTQILHKGTSQKAMGQQSYFFLNRTPDALVNNWIRPGILYKNRITHYILK